ncbi:hypothetical protein P5673_021911 [Acropora cervicornis]|uniref:Uncharacterized protein n=1 Tax=Acropora cervicornis TaxID=6130 RepID=A0AAD9V061_ACRCE|nr:hypothetical protein P5673_021911 [Acropora cervicornis]
MAAFTIASLVSFFAEEKRSITRGKNHYRSDHLEIFAYADGVIRGTVHASMKKKSSKMTTYLSNGNITLTDCDCPRGAYN